MKAQHPVSYQVCATVKRRCLWMLLLSSMRRSSLGELRGDRVVGDNLGDIEDGDLRPLGWRGRSCCNRFSLRMRTRSSFKPTCSPWWSCFGGTANVSWLPPGWAISWESEVSLSCCSYPLKRKLQNSEVDNRTRADSKSFLHWSQGVRSYGKIQPELRSG